MNRSEILKQADGIVNGERQNQYGSPERSFTFIAELWSDYLHMMISDKDVALMMILMKVAREAGGDGKMDNWVDIAGYAACGGEIASKQYESGSYTHKLSKAMNAFIDHEEDEDDDADNA